PLVELIVGLLVVTGQADLEAGKDLLRNPYVEVVGALGAGRRVLCHLGSCRGVRELREDRGRNELLARRGEVAGGAGGAGSAGPAGGRVGAWGRRRALTRGLSCHSLRKAS